jgi:DNA replication and repair protein RecF
MSYSSNAAPLPGERPREALARRLRETADKEQWNGSTLIGPHRDDLIFSIGGRDLSTFASRGQQRTAILALKLAELDILTALDGKPPLLLLDDVFSELDPARRGHLVRRIAALPQALITTTDPADIDADLRRQARSWQVMAGDDDNPGGARIVGGDR